MKYPQHRAEPQNKFQPGKIDGQKDLHRTGKKSELPEGQQEADGVGDLGQPRDQKDTAQDQPEKSRLPRRTTGSSKRILQEP